MTPNVKSDLIAASERKSDGGPAFPAIDRIIGRGHALEDRLVLGMTLHDYIAVHALAAIIQADGIQYASNPLAQKAHVKAALDHADAMLEARNA